MTKVKICGITNLSDAQMAADLGADMLGFNFFPGSRRFIGDRARHISERLPGSVKKVGIFVDQGMDHILASVSEARLDALQLHGEETQEFVAELRSHISPSVDIVKAFRVGLGFEPRQTQMYGVEYILLDTLGMTGDRGGTGETFDWTIANALPISSKVLFLAGGLTPDNVAGAISFVRPYAVDVASGVESSPGKKDPKLVEAFIRNAKNA